MIGQKIRSAIIKSLTSIQGDVPYSSLPENAFPIPPKHFSLNLFSNGVGREPYDPISVFVDVVDACFCFVENKIVPPCVFSRRETICETAKTVRHESCEIVAVLRHDRDTDIKRSIAATGPVFVLVHERDARVIVGWNEKHWIDRFNTPVPFGFEAVQVVCRKKPVVESFLVDSLYQPQSLLTENSKVLVTVSVLALVALFGYFIARGC
jgi:hypothetical protein